MLIAHLTSCFASDRATAVTQSSYSRGHGFKSRRVLDFFPSMFLLFLSLLLTASFLSISPFIPPTSIVNDSITFPTYFPFWFFSQTCHSFYFTFSLVLTTLCILLITSFVSSEYYRVLLSELKLYLEHLPISKINS